MLADLKFKKDGVRFNVRISDHTKPSENNAVISAVYLKIQNKKHYNTHRLVETWIIDASLGNVQPQNIVKIVTRISRLWKRYDSYAGHRLLKEFARNIKYQSR